MLSDAHKQAALEHLNEICPDTFDEGEFGPWKFTGLSRKGDEWSLAFENSEGDDGITFTFAGDCVDGSGSVVDEWFEQINSGILEWEQEVAGY
ncbi:MAG: hypothetical protein AB1Z98_18945 [Nannocystaceae bacterium]